MTTEERITVSNLKEEGRLLKIALELAQDGVANYKMQLEVTETVAQGLAVDVTELEEKVKLAQETIKGYKLQLNARGYYEVER